MKIKIFLNLFFALIISCLFLSPVKALDFTPPPFKDSGYLGKYVSVSLAEPIQIETDKTKEAIVKIKNVGTKTWTATGNNFVSVYTIDPNYHDSALAADDWLSPSNPVKISQTTKPGEIATIKFKIKAPSKVGTYSEKFYLAAENATWIKSSYFNLTIKVVKSTTASTTVSNNSKTSSTTYTGKVLGMTSKYLTAAMGGDQFNFSLKFQNLGKNDWQSYQLVGEVASSTIKDISWESSDIIITRSQKGEAGKDTGWINFKLRAPLLASDYDVKFYLKINGQKVAGTEEIVKISVLEDGADQENINYTNTTTSAVSTTTAETEDVVLRTRALIAEPKIRVRLAKVDSLIKFVAPTSYKVYAGDEYKGELEANVLATLNFLKGDVSVYTFKSSQFNFTTTDRIRFEPENADDYFEVPTFARTITWKGETRFASYRGVMEFVHSDKSDETYIVNELSMNQYLNGIGEMSDDSPYEYMKALIVAARSYAYSQIITGPTTRTYDVYASTVDQLYLGYNHEIESPNTVRAVTDTAGEMVTYNNNPVVTPYFGHSDGRTRSWKEVWGADKPWLKSVKTPYDKGKKMFGHGVGISMDDAAARARKDGWNYLKILKYYYTGVEVEQAY